MKSPFTHVNVALIYSCGEKNNAFSESVAICEDAQHFFFGVFITSVCIFIYVIIQPAKNARGNKPFCHKYFLCL